MYYTLFIVIYLWNVLTRAIAYVLHVLSLGEMFLHTVVNVKNPTSVNHNLNLILRCKRNLYCTLSEKKRLMSTTNEKQKNI